jgi:hypothetical protein
MIALAISPADAKGKTSTSGDNSGEAAASSSGTNQSEDKVKMESVSDAADRVFQTTINGIVKAESSSSKEIGSDAGKASAGIKGSVNVNGGIGHVYGYAAAHKALKKLTGAQFGPEDAWVQVDALISAKAKGTDGQKSAKANSGKIALYATANGGAVPSAHAVATKNGKVIVSASAVAGVGATASGGTHTVIQHFGPHGQDEVAVTYTSKALAEAIETPKTATAFSEYAARGHAFTAKDIKAAIMVAAEAYATAGNNYAYGYGAVAAKAHAIGGSSKSRAWLLLQAEGLAVGVKQKDPPPATPPVVILTGIDPVTHQAVQHECSWGGTSGQLFCKPVMKR